MINGNEEDTTQNTYKMDYRRTQAKLAKVKILFFFFFPISNIYSDVCSFDLD